VDEALNGRQFDVATYPSLKDRVVIVIGGASGIAMVTAFEIQHAKVVFRDTEDAAAKRLVQRIESSSLPAPHTIMVTLPRSTYCNERSKKFRCFSARSFLKMWALELLLFYRFEHDAFISVIHT
jgi:hypothetical protein